MMRRVLPSGFKTLTRACDSKWARWVSSQTNNSRPSFLGISTERPGGYDDTVKNLLISEKTRVVYHNINGRMASFNAEESLKWGTQVVGGVQVNFEGEHETLALPVVRTVREAMERLRPDAIGVYVPARAAAAAIEESIEAEVPLIVAVAEHIPLHQMLKIHEMLATQSKSRLVGANSPGIISPIGKCRIGFQPLASYSPGPVGLAAKSGTLSYEAATSLTREGIGQSLCIGVGGDTISGTSLVDALKVFEHDDNTKAIALIGEIGGTSEIEAADWISNYRSRVSHPKPIAALVAGRCAVPGKVMGHAGAWTAPGDPSALDKLKALKAAGAVIVNHPGDFGKVMKELLPIGSTHSSHVLCTAPSNMRPSSMMRRPTTNSTTHMSRIQLKGTRSFHLKPGLGFYLLRGQGLSVWNPGRFLVAGHITLTVDRSARSPCLIVKSNDKPSETLKLPFPYSKFLSKADFDAAFKLLSLGCSSEDFQRTIGTLWAMYKASNATSLSVSVGETKKKGQFGLVNAAITIDDAVYISSQQEQIINKATGSYKVHPSELRGARAGLVYIPLDQGDGEEPMVGTLVNGAGLAMNTIDCLNRHGLQVSNFLDTGGKATAETVAESMRLILLDKRVKVVFVNIFGGLTKCDLIAQGVAAALNELKPDVPVVVRLRGTREAEAEVELRSADPAAKLYPESDFERAVSKVKELLKKAAEGQ